MCVDLARLAVEALRVVDPASKPTYLMIEFDPVSVSGRIAGPYASPQVSIDAYASDRGRRIVAFRELASYARQKRTLANRQVAEPRP